MAYYEGKVEQEYVDGLERMQVLGLSALDELQARLEADPEGWTKRELMELAELLLIKQRLPGERREVSPGGVRVNVQFVTAESSRPPAKVIEHFGESPEGLDDRYHAAGHFAGGREIARAAGVGADGAGSAGDA